MFRPAVCVAGIALLTAVMAESGCSYFQRQEITKDSGPATPPPVRLDPSRNGAVNAGKANAGVNGGDGDRAELAFVMSGTGRPVDSGTEQERKQAMMQAAIVESLCNAVAETRRQHGETGDDFEAKLGPRLSLTCKKTSSGGREIEARLAAGRTVVFHTKDGVLQHAPHGFDSIQRLFAETTGRFELLSTEAGPDGNDCVASVGCYRDLNDAANGPAAHPIPSSSGNAP